jgi:RNA polymerase sigma-70 factor (ECF subfamily)
LNPLPTDSVSDCSGADLFSARVADDNAWFVECVLPHEPALRRWLRSRFPHADTDDLVQESFLRIIRAHGTAAISHPKTYLFSTARNLALNQARHDCHENREALREIAPSTVIDDAPGIPESFARRQEHELLIEALQSLPDRCRQVFTLRRIYGLPVKQIAAELGISEKTADAHISMALRRCTDFMRNADARVRANRAPLRCAPIEASQVRHA